MPEGEDGNFREKCPARHVDEELATHLLPGSVAAALFKSVLWILCQVGGAETAAQ